jgi:hypothetical protein
VNQNREMTERQVAALAEMIADVRVNHGIEMSEWDRHNHDWRTTFADEVRPGRGHDLDLLYLDGESVVQITLDSYGHGHLSIGATLWSHNSSDDECGCGPCTTEREQEDREAAE